MSKLKCPHCTKLITLEDLSTEAINEFANIDIDAKVQLEVDTVTKQLKDKLKKDTLKKEKAFKENLEKEREKLELLQDEIYEEKQNLKKESKKINQEKMEKFEEDFERKEKQMKEKFKNDLAEMEKTHSIKIDRYEKKVQELAAGSGGDGELKGEAFEEEVKRIVKQEFPEFEVTDVSKGVKGADLIITTYRGKILIEAKNTKNWGGDWVNKLKEDIQRENADYGIIVTNGVMPPNSGNKKYVPSGPNVGIAEFSNFLPVLRIRAEFIQMVKDNELKLQGSNEKKDQLYAFVNSTRFANTVNTILDSLKAQKDLLRKEEEAASKFFKQREVLNNKVWENFYSAFEVQIQSYILEPRNTDSALIDESIDIENAEINDSGD